MRPLPNLFFLLVIPLILSGCASNRATPMPTRAEIQLPSPISVPPTATTTPSPTPTTTPTRLPTLTPAEARETIKTLLQKPVDCSAPCFWGITPGQSTFADAVRAITHFGLQLLYSNTLDNKDFRESKYVFDSGLSVSPLLAIQDDVVENITVGIHPEKQRAGVPREWLAYSPETLISRYGLPSKVNFAVDRGEFPSYGMVMYFDAEDLIVEYYSYDLGAKMQICPLTDQMDSVGLWMGQESQHPPVEDVPLEKATSMTMQEFSKLMTGPANNACFNLKEEMFP